MHKMKQSKTGRIITGKQGEWHLKFACSGTYHSSNGTGVNNKGKEVCFGDHKFKKLKEQIPQCPSTPDMVSGIGCKRSCAHIHVKG